MESVGGAPTDDERRPMMPEVIRIPKSLPLELRVRIVESYARRNELIIQGNPKRWNWLEDILLSKSLNFEKITGYVGVSDDEWYTEDNGYYLVPYQRYLPDHPIPKQLLTDKRITFDALPT